MNTAANFGFQVFILVLMYSLFVFKELDQFPSGPKAFACLYIAAFPAGPCKNLGEFLMLLGVSSVLFTLHFMIFMC